MERARVTLGRIGPGLFLPRNLDSPGGLSGRSDGRNLEANAEGDAPGELAVATASDEPLEV
jgi:hypothetical protein